MSMQEYRRIQRMGTDISGWVEVKRAPDESWTALMPIDSIVYRPYGMFASLFGIRNQGHMKSGAGAPGFSR